MDNDVLGEKAAVSVFYTHDHDQLDGFFKEFQASKHLDYPMAKGFFKQFKFGLQRHILWEEEILFPCFENKTGLVDSGPTWVMREEHRQIEAVLELLHQKVRRADPASDEEESLLSSILAEHNRKEEEVLYPALDRLTSPEEKQAIFAGMESLPEAQYKTCGCQCHHG
ncbi:MAG: hemerythrin domain-containing protein [Candidatus Omnitrophota bacterium]|nr:hemerythrin domain-containing protein [Candidatus Omnitrophota bacterium]MDZ4242668.1 hemerythrin domain-containing protein [Candidatus Omnitrophota bacterium]